MTPAGRLMFMRVVADELTKLHSTHADFFVSFFVDDIYIHAQFHLHSFHRQLRMCYSKREVSIDTLRPFPPIFPELFTYDMASILVFLVALQ